MAQDTDKWHRRYLDLALQIGQWSKHPVWKIGAVAIGDHGQVLSAGYNGWPRGLDGEDAFHKKGSMLSRMDLPKSLTVHAEENAVCNACLNGISLCRSTLYVCPMFPCVDCAKMIIQVGISQICYKNTETLEKVDSKWDVDWQISKELFRETGIKVTRIDG